MNELQRQGYLKAMGLTPWVARTPLPGAAPSPALDWPEKEGAVETAAAGSAVNVAVSSPRNEPPSAPSPSPVAPQERAADTPAPGTSAAEALARAPSSRPTATVTAAQEDKAIAPPSEIKKVQGLTFTLEAHLGGTTWLLCAQEDSQAPGLGRFEAPLMASLLALFQGRPQRPRRFFCPLTEQPMPAHEAAQALSAFVAGLSEHNGGERVLLCLPEAVCEALFQQARYQPFELASMPALVISSLAEMLADPAQHKKASWHAMQAHGYDGT